MIIFAKRQFSHFEFIMLVSLEIRGPHTGDLEGERSFLVCGPRKRGIFKLSTLRKSSFDSPSDKPVLETFLFSPKGKIR